MSGLKPIIMTKYEMEDAKLGAIATECPFRIMSFDKVVKAGSMWCASDCKHFVSRNNRKQFVVCSVVEKEDGKINSNNQDS